MAYYGGGPHSFANTNIPVAIQSALGTFLHLHGGVANNEAHITTWQWVDQPNLKWYIESVPGHHDIFYISSAVDRNFVLHQLGANSDNGGALTTWDKRTHGQQGNLQVRFEQSGDGFWFIKFVHSGKNIHVSGAALANGTPITQWETVNQPNLKWKFLPAGSDPHSPANYGAHGVGAKVAIQSGVGTFMHVHGGVPADGTKITAWSWVDQANLKWHIEAVPGKPGFFFLSSVANPQFVLHQLGANSNNGGECTTWNKATHGHQGNLQVSFEAAGNDYWYIKFAHSGKYAHVSGASTANDTPITQWEKVDQPNLKWRIFPVS